MRRSSITPFAFIVLALFVMASTAGAATVTWTGAINGTWSNTSNWDIGAVPAAGDTLIFSSSATTKAMNNDLPAGTTFASLTFNDSSYTLTGNAIGVNSLVRCTAGTSSVAAPLELHGNTVFWNVNASGAVTLNGFTLEARIATISGAITGTSTVTLNSGVLSGASPSFTGATVVMGETQGTIYGTQPNSAVTVQSLGQLMGNGSVGNLTLSSSGSSVSPQSVSSVTGKLTTKNVTFGNSTTLNVDVAGANAGTNYDQLAVTGTVTINSSVSLQLSLDSGLSPAVNQVWTLIDNDGADAISGSFSGKGDGYTFSTLGATFELDYQGGDGNDLTLRCTAAPRTWTGAGANTKWSNGANWDGGTVPSAGSQLVFPESATNRTMDNDLTAGTSFSSLAFSHSTGSAYTLTGNAFTVSGGMTTSRSVTISAPVTISASQTFNGSFTFNGAVTLGSSTLTLALATINGGVSGTGNVVLNSGTLNGTNTFTGTTSVLSSGSGAIHATQSQSPVSVLQGGVLTASGTLGQVSVAQDATLQPAGTSSNYATVNTSSLAFNGVAGGSAHLSLEVNGTTAGTNFDQLVVNGTVTITQAQLSLTINSGLTPYSGLVLKLIDNDGNDAIVGTFSGVTSPFDVNGATFALSYTGGDGNDLTLTCTAAPKSWTGNGGAADPNWLTAANWSTGTPVIANDMLVFPESPSNRTMNNDAPAGTQFTSLTFAHTSGASYVLSGNQFALTAGITSTSNSTTISAPIALSASQAFTGQLTFNGTVTLNGNTLTTGGVMNGIISDGSAPGNLILSSATLTADNSYSGTTTIPNGDTGTIYGSQPNSNVIVAQSAMFRGSGTVGDLTVGAAASLQPLTAVSSHARVTTKNLTFNGTAGNLAHLLMQVEGAAAGTDYDQIVVNGAVALNDYTQLDLTISVDLIPTLNQVFTLIDNDGADAVTGEFNGLPNDSVVTVNGYQYKLSYFGGTGNDVTLTSLNGKTGSTTTLLSSLNPATAGQSVTFSATVTGSLGTPVGNIIFKDGTTTLDTVALNASGQAAYSTSSLAAGTHQITATYTGSAQYNTSSSSAVSQQIDPNTTTTLTSSANPSRTGSPVTFTAVVSPTPAGGTVEFRSGVNTLSTVAIAGNTATYTTSALTEGTYSITAIFSGYDTLTASTSATLTQQVLALSTTRSDLSGDGKSDLVLQNSSSNSIAGWLMNNTTITSAAVVATPASDWKAAATGDLDGDGKFDIVLKNGATRAIALWRMNGTTLVSGTTIAVPASDWRVAAAFDFTNDGKADLILQNAAGSVAEWQMNGSTLMAGSVIATPGADWNVITAATINGSAALVLQNSATGAVARWLLSGSTITSNVTVATPAIAWKLKAAGDVTGDGSSELILQNDSTNAVAVWTLSPSGTLQTGKVIATPTSAWKVCGAGDYDGDNRMDILLQNATTNAIAIWKTDGTTLLSGTTIATPVAGWKPIVN